MENKNAKVDALAKTAVQKMFELKGVDHTFPFDEIWNFLPPNETIPSASRSPQGRKLRDAGYIRATGKQIKATTASRRGNTVPQYMFGQHFGDGGNDEKLNEDLTRLLRESFENAHLKCAPSLLLRFIAALTTKPFCLLTGLAGSGKTKVAEAVARWLCETTDQFRVVAVGADWTSNENLLGYPDALQSGVYRPPVNGVLELILRADADQERPYFLILDEMNLSHVERYFADFLSAMESESALLSLHGSAEALKAGIGDVPGSLALPKNLFIIGTVNVDETTYMFSPKVLDRANVIEFRASREQMASFLDDPAAINLHDLAGQGSEFASAFVLRANSEALIVDVVDESGNSVHDRLKHDLLEAFNALEEIGAEFGFRTAKEIARFVTIHRELSGADWHYKAALDAQVLQKLMPKLHGSARKLEGVLAALASFAAARDLTLTSEKIARMQKRLDRDGFTSFAEA